MVTFRRARPAAGVLALCSTAALAGALTACGGGGTADGKPPTAASSAGPAVSASPVEPEAADRAAALEAYTAMWAERMEAYRQASTEGTDLKRYATHDALGGLERELTRMKENDTVIRGDLGHAPEVTALEAGARRTAKIEDCLDLSQWRTLDTTTGWPIPLPSGQPRRYVATATVQRSDGGRWMVTEYTQDSARTC
ncbi:hypothetical protein [Streptomyces sp. NRRL WC-3549]|uniref:hypothetical protein n=1 Tax=Streptomyces sp. NRRL WC-3549 TaxID=1463925 RepID=UPI000B03FAF3|nr:hypothetical protein [Streptomyces sp. NRRL WC-3549]